MIQLNMEVQFSIQGTIRQKRLILIRESLAFKHANIVLSIIVNR